MWYPKTPPHPSRSNIGFFLASNHVQSHPKRIGMVRVIPNPFLNGHTKRTDPQGGSNGCFQKQGYPKMDGENHGNAYFLWDDLVVFTPIFGNTQWVVRRPPTDKDHGFRHPWYESGV